VFAVSGEQTQWRADKIPSRPARGCRGTHVRELDRTTGVHLGREYGATALKKHAHIPQIRQDPELNSEEEEEEEFYTHRCEPVS